MDATPPIDDDNLARMWHELADVLGQMTRHPCGACAGSGMCTGCKGYGRILLRDMGSFKCSRCQGDGGCPACTGTGQAFPA